MKAVKLYIFDVDGTLRFTTVPGQNYPLNCHQWRLMPHVAEMLRNTRWDTGRRWLAVCSNQLGVGDRYLSRRVARELIQDTVAAAVGYPSTYHHRHVHLPRRRLVPTHETQSRHAAGASRAL